MKLNQTNASYEISIPEGIHKAVIYSVVDLWTQTINSAQYGEQKKRQVLISFEIPSIKKVFDKEKWEQAVAISKTYTLSMHEKARLRELANAVKGRPLSEMEAEEMEMSELLGGNVMLTIEHNQWYANIKAISKIFDKEILLPTNTTRLFELDKPDFAVMKTMHQKLQDKIMNSPEYEVAIGMDKVEEEVINDDLPF